jgi:hypothetical protein
VGTRAIRDSDIVRFSLAIKTDFASQTISVIVVRLGPVIH